MFYPAELVEKVFQIIYQATVKDYGLDISQYHEAKKVYHHFQDGEFTVNYSFLSKILTEQGIREKFLADSEVLEIKKITADDKNQNVTVTAEAYRLLEN